MYDRFIKVSIKNNFKNESVHPDNKRYWKISQKLGQTFVVTYQDENYIHKLQWTSFGIYVKASKKILVHLIKIFKKRNSKDGMSYIQEPHILYEILLLRKWMIKIWYYRGIKS